MKKFCFLIQARNDEDYFNQFDSDDSDCYVLFFNKPSNRKNSIYAPNTSWNRGRNLLLETAFEKEDYEYYIFMDDDARIVDNFDNRINCVEEFKQLLLKKKPAIAFPDYQWHLLGNSGRNRGNAKTKAIRDGIAREDFTSRTMFYDACVNAFHKNIIKFCLPYEEKFDKTNWWISQEMLCHFNRIFIPESILQFNSIITLNLTSCNYPKEGGPRVFNKYYREYLMSVKKDPEHVFPAYPSNRSQSFEEPFVSMDELSVEELESRYSEIFDLNHEFISKKIDFWKDK